ncbi:hypothetical protein NPIL_549021 [Nephila pilipes]|uniref:Uncharacterized protein n=1 Tax=Nephila pilipes TaxID=299642 RepID=A0A8X6NW66_NEPPI|nr:hypothetical protein NPIL_549021 [Nephila pilipes]
MQDICNISSSFSFQTLNLLRRLSTPLSRSTEPVRLLENPINHGIWGICLFAISSDFPYLNIVVPLNRDSFDWCQALLYAIPVFYLCRKHRTFNKDLEFHRSCYWVAEICPTGGF